MDAWIFGTIDISRAKSRGVEFEVNEKMTRQERKIQENTRADKARQGKSKNKSG